MTNCQWIISLCHSILPTLQTRSSPSKTESNLQSGCPLYLFATQFCFCHLKWQRENESPLQVWIILPYRGIIFWNLPYMDLHIAETSELLFNMFRKFDWSDVISWSLHKVPSEILTLSIENTFLPGFTFSTKQKTYNNQDQKHLQKSDVVSIHLFSPVWKYGNIK